MPDLRASLHTASCRQACLDSVLPVPEIVSGRAKQLMQIGEPLRILIVEPLELPVNPSPSPLQPIAPEPDPEGEPASK